MTAERITIRERIDPAISAALFSNYRSSADAVLELIDNAVDSRLGRSELTIEVAAHPTSLVVLSSGGDGMGVRELERNYLRGAALANAVDTFSELAAGIRARARANSFGC
jgi:hypothetical protein